MRRTAEVDVVTGDFVGELDIGEDPEDVRLTVVAAGGLTVTGCTRVGVCGVRVGGG